MVKRTTIACFFIIFIAGLCIFPVSAQDLKLGVFDVQKIMRESKTIAGYRQDLLKNIDLKRKPLQGKDEFAKALDEKLKKDGNTMSPADRKILEERLANEIKEIRRMKEDFDAEALKMDRELTQRMFLEIDAAIRKITAQEDYTIIFEKTAAGIVHFKTTVDITNKILDQLK
ncbi:MAG: OmpH family outer membrane protein [Proteobacteria bacterium]|nr:OmpH family outer membrane protein [Pseudomonadota bacterium]